jgi:hypothetical protein
MVKLVLSHPFPDPFVRYSIWWTQMQLADVHLIAANAEKQH